MTFFTRLSNGWQIAMNSFKVLKANKHLIIFPILSGISMMLILGSIIGAMVGVSGGLDFVDFPDNAVAYVSIFVYYIVNYFVIVFFNMALIHCTSLYFKGEEATVRDGINFSMSRIGKIFSWALLAGTVGAVLNIIQENLGSLGKILVGLIGLVWNIATFFVIPVIAYENLGPLDALKESTKMMREKWGEKIGAGFSFGIINIIGFLLILALGFIIGSLVHPLAGIVVGILCLLAMVVIMSAARTIFISAVYHNVTGDPVEHYNDAFIDNLFVSKN